MIIDLSSCCGLYAAEFSAFLDPTPLRPQAPFRFKHREGCLALSGRGVSQFACLAFIPPRWASTERAAGATGTSGKGILRKVKGRAKIVRKVVSHQSSAFPIDFMCASNLCPKQYFLLTIFCNQFCFCCCCRCCYCCFCYRCFSLSSLPSPRGGPQAGVLQPRVPDPHRTPQYLLPPHRPGRLWSSARPAS